MTEPPYFVDANVPMYAAGAEHPLKRPCIAILEAVARGDLLASTSVEIFQEILHRYAAIGQRLRAVEVAIRFLRIIPAPFPVTVFDLRRAMELLAGHPDLQARDVLHVAVMENNGLTHIISADQHFDAVSSIVRVDLAAWATGRRT